MFNDRYSSRRGGRRDRDAIGPRDGQSPRRGQSSGGGRGRASVLDQMRALLERAERAQGSRSSYSSRRRSKQRGRARERFDGDGDQDDQFGSGVRIGHRL